MSDQDKVSSASLASMMSTLKILEREIDESEEISLEQCETHFNQIQSIDEKVDRLLAYIDIAKMNAAMYAEREEELKKASESWDKKRKSLEKYALFLASHYPDIEWRGTDRTFRKKLNQPSLNVPLKKSVSISSAIPEELVGNVPQKYLELVTVWKLKTDLLKEDLKAGEKFDWADLVQTEKLEISVKKLKGKK